MRFDKSKKVPGHLALVLLCIALTVVPTLQQTTTEQYNKCPTQCDLSALIPTDNSVLTIGPANSNYTVNSARLVSLVDNVISVSPQQDWTAGQIILLYQATGATVDVSNVNSSSYGTITSLGNAGNWEFVKIKESMNGGTIFTLVCNSANTYETGQTFVIEPLVANTINLAAGVTIIAAGLDVGISAERKNPVVALVANTINMGVNSSISATGKGFLGGVRGGVNTSLICVSCLDTCKQDAYSYDDKTWGAIRGGSVVLNPPETYGRGAIANGGGGGNNHNAPGGGGANGWRASSLGSTVEAPEDWTGMGVMDTAWAEGFKFETTTPYNSIGGGRGGYSFSAFKSDPLVKGPEDCIWAGNGRRNNGGLGGRPLQFFSGNAMYSKLFLGGGGGAGHENDWVGGNGGNGGGFVAIIANSINGSAGATIQANGIDGNGTEYWKVPKGPYDGSGGGGAGGSIFLTAYGTSGILGSVNITAKGGRGGDNIIVSTEESEGGGGGGGGGVVALALNPNSGYYASACRTASVAGGQSGYQVGDSWFSTFLPNGGTDGSEGQCVLITASYPCIASVSLTPSVTRSPSATISISPSVSFSTSIRSSSVVSPTPNKLTSSIHVPTSSSGPSTGPSTSSTSWGSGSGSGSITGGNAVTPTGTTGTTGKGGHKKTKKPNNNKHHRSTTGHHHVSGSSFINVSFVLAVLCATVLFFM